MAKSKNHTAHNQTHKQHRNDIHKPKRQCYQESRELISNSSATCAAKAKTS